MAKKKKFPPDSFKESEYKDMTRKQQAMINLLNTIVLKVMSLRILISEKSEIYNAGRWDDEN